MFPGEAKCQGGGCQQGIFRGEKIVRGEFSEGCPEKCPGRNIRGNLCWFRGGEVSEANLSGGNVRGIGA